jgi:gluconokinase
MRNSSSQPMRDSNDQPLVIALDIGSSGIKAVAFDSRAQAVPELVARAPFALEAMHDGGSEVNLDKLERAVYSVMDELHAKLGQHEILAVALTGFAPSLVALDADGQELAPALSYADTRSQGFVSTRRDADLMDRSGCPAYSSLWSAQIPWWMAQQPETDVRRWLSVPDYILSRWFGLEHLSTTYSLAAWTGLLNRHALEWDRRSLKALKLEPRSFLPLADHDAPQVGLPEPWRSRWPRFSDVPFFPAVGDGAAANIGSGAIGRAAIAVTVGTSAAVRAALPSPVKTIPDGLWAYRVTRDCALVGGALTEGGNLFAWARETLRLEDDLESRLESQLESQLKQFGPDAHGLTFIPSFAGERSPGYRPNARGTVHGLSLASTPLELLCAALEGVTYRLADLIERLGPIMEPEAQVILSGNAILASPFWSQMLADALGRRVTCCAEPEATARGAAILALMALGLGGLDSGGLDSGGLESFPARLGATLEPNFERHEKYRRGLERQRSLIRKLA